MDHTAYIPVNDNMYRIQTKCLGRVPTGIIIGNDEEAAKSTFCTLQSGSHDDPIIITDEGPEENPASGDEKGDSVSTNCLKCCSEETVFGGEKSYSENLNGDEDVIILDLSWTSDESQGDEDVIILDLSCTSGESQGDADVISLHLSWTSDKSQRDEDVISLDLSWTSDKSQRDEDVISLDLSCTSGESQGTVPFLI